MFILKQGPGCLAAKYYCRPSTQSIWYYSVISTQSRPPQCYIGLCMPIGRRGFLIGNQVITVTTALLSYGAVSIVLELH